MPQNCDNLHPTSQFTGSYVWVYENRRWAAYGVNSVSFFTKPFNCLLIICCPLRPQVPHPRWTGLPRRGRDACPTQPPSIRSGAAVGNHPSPTQQKAGSQLPAQHCQGDVQEWQRQGKGGNKLYTSCWHFEVRTDSHHLPKALYSSPQHSRWGSWGFCDLLLFILAVFKRITHFGIRYHVLGLGLQSNN